MAEIIWAESALSELDDIAEYIALSNPYAAENLVQKVFEKTQRLELFPLSGKTPDEIPELGYLEVVVNPCRVLYKYETDNDIAFILHVVRQERKLRNFILNEENS
jgi:toxin ParE1/3/4